MKKNIEWYRHRKDSHRHPKFKLLRATYGSNGWAYEGRFWALNNIIADCENCQLDLSKIRTKAVVADEIGLTIDQLTEFLTTLCSDEIELIIKVDHEIYSTKKIKESLEEAMKTREKERYRKSLGGKEQIPDGKEQIPPQQNNRVKESKVKEIRKEESKREFSRTGNVDNSVDNSSFLPTNEPSLLFENSSSFTFYQDCLPFDFQDSDAVRNSVTQLIAKFCNGAAPTKSEITRIFNIVTGTRGAKPETCFKITAETLSEFPTLSLEKKNFTYLSRRIEGKINDALTKAREDHAAKLKQNEQKEIENMNGNEVLSHVERLKQKFNFTQSLSKSGV